MSISKSIEGSSFLLGQTSKWLSFWEHQNWSLKTAEALGITEHTDQPWRYTYMNGFKSRNEVERIKELYPVGTRIELIGMDDPYAPVESGIQGTVEIVDDAGTYG